MKVIFGDVEALQSVFTMGYNCVCASIISPLSRYQDNGTNME